MVSNVQASRLRALGRLAGVLLALAAVTFACHHAEVNAITTGFVYLIAVLLVATAWGLALAIVASAVAMVCFNFFFLPPLGTLTISDPQNWVALFAFLLTSIVASELSARAKRQARAALDRQRELERLYALGRAILLDAGDGPLAQRLAHWVAESFGFPGVVLYDVQGAKEYKAGPEDLTIPDDVQRAALSGEIGERSDDTYGRFALVRLGGKPAGLLALRGTVSDTAVDAIASLVAIGLERARTQDAQNRAEAARQSEQLKSTLLDAIAHEFKTPLTSIKAAATTVLADSGIGAQQRELLSVVDEETDRLSDLVSDAIQTSRIEAGELKLNPTRTSARDLIHATVARMRVRLEDRPVEEAVREDMPPVMVDRDLMQLALRQLIDNALKYSPPGTPIALGAACDAATVSFWVADRGPGVPAADRERVFQKFYRAGSNRHGVPGSGIGLSVVREIARAHGGEASVETGSGDGARFVVTVPLAREDTQ
jgi:two-component system sensor histidine kinase KdpD